MVKDLFLKLKKRMEETVDLTIGREGLSATPEEEEETKVLPVST